MKDQEYLKHFVYPLGFKLWGILYCANHFIAILFGDL